MARRRLTADEHLDIRLSTTASRLARSGAGRAAAVAELRDIAGGRADVLARACGRAIGGFLAVPSTFQPADMCASALLFEAGADPALVVAAVDEARRTAGGHHTTAQFAHVRRPGDTPPGDWLTG